MDFNFLFYLLFLTIVAVVAIVMLMLKKQAQVELLKLKNEINIQKQTYFLPSKLEAYQRCILLLDRISPANLTLRTLNINQTARAQQSVLIKTVRDEYEHNIAQQLFISEEGWQILVHAKEEVLRVINLAANSLNKDATATELATKILEITAKIDPFPTEICRAFIQKEFRDFYA